MMSDTEKWSVAVDGYISGAKTAFKSWANVVATIKKTTGTDLDAISGKVTGITSASDAMVEAILGKDGKG
jgi:hypothetical protein